MASNPRRENGKRTASADAFDLMAQGLNEEVDQRRPLERIARQSRSILELCDTLEAMADDLPNKVLSVWRQVSRCCQDIVPKHYSEVSAGLVPLLAKRVEGNADLEDALMRFHVDYLEEDARTSEFVGLIESTLNSEYPLLDPNALGYSFRAYFDLTRRQMEWERDVLMPMAVRHLTQSDLASLMRA